MTTTASETTRLHITPFTPDLLPSVLPSSVRPSATDISFHSIPTFPENNYGYVTLPTMEADKIKKKLNGSILKGRKFRVETARSPKRQEVEVEADTVKSTTKTTSDNVSKKRKAHDNVLDGYELPSGRQVKRGWTESTNAKNERRKGEKMKKGKEEKKSKTQAKSKYTEKSECLFRTKLPKNRSASPDEKQEKQAKKKKKSPQESVVHEFATTITQPSFLRSEGDGAAPTSAFEEGKGWIDHTGNLKETVSDRLRKDQYRPGQVAGAKEKRKSVKAPTTAQETHLEKAKDDKIDSADESEDWTSSSGTTSSDDSRTDSESEDSMSSASSESGASFSQDEQQQLHTLPVKGEASSPPKTDEPEVPGSAPPSAETTHGTASKDVHPLEALFKRPAVESSDSKPAPETNTQFSFFGQDDIESEEEEEQNKEPQTPFTKKDLLSRGLRSAAPTPDTVLINRKFDWNNDDSDAMEVTEYTDTPITRSETKAGLKEDSEFTKWFWENRGDNNRAWKKRRRDAAKEQRQRENRRKGMKGKS
ncbi:hypothetical protein IFM61606_06735 [Aspergillus udagawae]|uniref:Suppressor protein SRP40 n=1 Tax=Aspergillus udagawae TaxID=91492 RepID=A0A8E0QWL8_9EURO|nr:uncharacterized protein Aud_009072 [Aspergillus udagawae]GFG26738.1 hypothetical protein IFM61606_06735 [Aspergillus udagawae]GIC92604.1 hypothetical protein Aud_009072 [Aspergillus udagawae]